MRVVTVARKPCLSSSTTTNVVEHEAGAINIEASRVGLPFVSAGGNNFDAWRGGEDRADRPAQHGQPSAVVTSGRWPTNVVILGSKTREALDAQSGQLTSGTGAVKRSSSKDQQGNRGAAYGAESRPDGAVMVTYGDTGGASRYYKCFEDGDQPK